MVPKLYQSKHGTKHVPTLIWHQNVPMLIWYQEYANVEMVPTNVPRFTWYQNDTKVETVPNMYQRVRGTKTMPKSKSYQIYTNAYMGTKPQS